MAIEDLTDQEIEELTSDPSGEETETPDETSTQEDESSLSYHLKTIGITEDDLPNPKEDPEGYALALAKKTDERIRGMQSGFSQLDNEVRSKAQKWDQFENSPELHQAMELIRSGRLSDKPEEEFKLTEEYLSSLPEDPLLRLSNVVEEVSKRTTQKTVSPELQEIKQTMSALQSMMGNMVWDNFVTAHPDAVEGQADIAKLVSAGYDLNDAYGAWRGMKLDPDEIREDALQTVRKRLQEKKKAAGAPLSTHRAGETPSTSDPTEVSKAREEGGRRAAFYKALAQNKEAVEALFGG